MKRNGLVVDKNMRVTRIRDFPEGKMSPVEMGNGLKLYRLRESQIDMIPLRAFVRVIGDGIEEA